MAVTFKQADTLGEGGRAVAAILAALQGSWRIAD